MTDIEHNRRGILSPAQAQMLLEQWRATKPNGPLFLWLWYGFLALTVGGCLIERDWLAALVLTPIAAVLATIATAAVREAQQRRPPPPPASVVAVDGRVVWGATGARSELLLPRAVAVPEYAWVPVRADGTLLVRRYCFVLLPPGPYRFYLCGDAVVGAESPYDPSTGWSMCQGGYGQGGVGYSGLPPAPLPVGDPGALFRVVSDALRFDENDLAHNRRGSLSPRQGAGAVLVLEGMIESCGRGNFGIVGDIASSAATAGGRVVPAPSVPPGFDGRWFMWWLVGGRAIWVPASVCWAVPVGVVYRVYLDARTERVVSVEPVPRAQTGSPR